MVGAPRDQTQFNLKLSIFHSNCICVNWVEGTLGELRTLTLSRATQGSFLGHLPSSSILAIGGRRPRTEIQTVLLAFGFDFPSRDLRILLACSANDSFLVQEVVIH